MGFTGSLLAVGTSVGVGTCSCSCLAVSVGTGGIESAAGVGSVGAVWESV